MTAFDEETLDQLIKDERDSGVPDAQISDIVYDYAFSNFDPVEQGEVDRVLKRHGLPTR